MDPTFRCQDGPDAATRVLIPCVDLDRTTAADIRHRVASALADGKRRLVVDLSDVGYLDSSAIAALLEATSRAQHHGSRLTVVTPDRSRVAMILNMTGVDRLLDICETLAEAFAPRLGPA
jgi:anti-sigma B factor antagonist